MKNQKRWLWVAGLVVAITLLSIGGAYVLAAVDAGDAALYYPLKPGNYWVFKGTFPNKSNFLYKTQVVKDDGDYKRVIVSDSAAPIADVYYVTNNQGLFKVKEITPNGVRRFEPLQPLLIPKLSVGASWKWESADKKWRESTKVVGTEKVTVPAGTFETLIVQCDGVDDSGKAYSGKTWYAKGIGYVKDVMTIDGKATTLELYKYELEK